MLVKVTRMMPRLQGQNHVDVNYEKKTFGPGAWLTIRSTIFAEVKIGVKNYKSRLIMARVIVF